MSWIFLCTLLLVLLIDTVNSQSANTTYLAQILAGLLAGDPCYNISDNCDGCVANPECVFCSTSLVPACMSGGLIRPSNLTLCGPGDWYWQQCKISGFSLGTNVSYLIILVIAILVLIIILIIIGCLIRCCCKHCCTSKGNDDKNIPMKNKPLSDSEKQKQMIKDIVSKTDMTNNEKVDNNNNNNNDNVTDDNKDDDNNNNNEKNVVKLSIDDDGDDDNDNSIGGLDSVLKSPSGDQKVNNDAPKVTLAAMNYFSQELLEKCLGKRISANIITDIISHRTKLGGVFWNLNQLYQCLQQVLPKELATLPQQQLWNSMYGLIQKIGIPDHVLFLITPQVVHYCDIEVITDGPGVKRAMINLIKSARQYINLSVMLYFNDDDAQEITDALIEKAQEGVKIRVMVDKLVTIFSNRLHKNPSRAEFRHQQKQMEQNGIEVINSTNETYFSGYWTALKRKELADKGVPEEYLVVQDYVQKNTSGSPINTVYHRKFMTVDDTRCWIGSCNIGSEYIYNGPLMPYPGSSTGIPPSEDNWHDGLCVVVSNELTRKLNRLFAIQWQCLGGDVFPCSPSDELGVVGDSSDSCALMISFPGNPTNPMANWVNNLMVHCDRHVILSVPYIIDKSFYKALQDINNDQQYRKISIVTCIEVNDLFLNQNAIQAYMPGYLDRGVSLYDYSDCGRFSHWKIYYDSSTDTIMHGSFNLNTRSVLHDFECGILIKSKKVSAKVLALLNNDIAVSKKLSEKDFGGFVSQLIDKGITELADYFS